MIGSSTFSVLSSRGHSQAQILKYTLYCISATMAVCCYTARYSDGMLTGQEGETNTISSLHAFRNLKKKESEVIIE